MAYKISGSINEDSTIFIFRELDNKCIIKESVSAGSYTIYLFDDSTITATAITTTKGPKSFSGITPESYSYSDTGGNRALVGHTQNSNVMNYFNMVQKGNASDFGDYGLASNENPGACSNGTNDRGVWAGGWDASYRGEIYYFTISTTGNASSFGSLSQSRSQLTGVSNHTNNRGVFCAGNNGSNQNTMDYITITSTGNAFDFGDLITARVTPTSFSNGTNERGLIIAGGVGGNTIEYITISSTGNAFDFGDLDYGNSEPGGTSNLTNNRGLICNATTAEEQIQRVQYVTISTLSNSNSFGGLSTGFEFCSAATSNGIGNLAFFCGGTASGVVRATVIDYKHMMTLGDAEDWGDLQVAMSTGHKAVSNS